MPVHPHAAQMHASTQGNAKFLDAVVTWQRRLGVVETVLGLWGDVQGKWSNLESVFVGSADIRVQLPGDAKRFEAVDADFQVGQHVGLATRRGVGCLLQCCSTSKRQDMNRAMDTGLDHAYAMQIICVRAGHDAQRA